MSLPRQSLVTLALFGAGLVGAVMSQGAWAQSAPANPFAANAALPGFAPLSPPATPSTAPQGSTLLNPSAWSGAPQAAKIPPPPPPPMTPEQIIREASGPKPTTPTGYAPRLANFSKPPEGIQAPALPTMPPVPSLATAPSYGTPSDLIDPSRIKDGTTPVTGSRIEATAGDTKIYLLKVSGTSPNLIQSPFAQPRMLTTSSASVQFKAHGRNLVISVTQAGPVGVYLTGSNPGDPVIGLVLDPAPTPPRSYTLEIAGYTPGSVAASSGKGSAEEAGSYVTSTVGLMRQVVEGHIPSNFTQTGKERLPQDQMFTGVRLHPVREYVAPGEKILVLKAKNENVHETRLVENDFYAKGVVAVVIAPEHRLKPGEETTVYVLSKQGQPESALLGVWQGAHGEEDTGGSLLDGSN